MGPFLNVGKINVPVEAFLARETDSPVFLLEQRGENRRSNNHRFHIPALFFLLAKKIKAEA